MALLYWALEQQGGTWTCRRETDCIDEHATLNEALAHLITLAEEDAPAYLCAHWLDGRVELMGETEADR